MPLDSNNNWVPGLTGPPSLPALPANSFYGLNSSATASEQKVFAASGSVIITHTAGIVTIGSSGYTLQGGGTGTFSPADATIYYIGFSNNSIAGALAIAGQRSLIVPKAGTIKSIGVETYIPTTLASNEAVTIDVLINTVTSVGSHTEDWSVTPTRNLITGLSQVVVAGDYLGLRIQCPTWATNPTPVQIGFTVYIE